MEDTWLGPYKVLKITDHSCCHLQCMKTGTEMNQKVYISQLKLYHESQNDDDKRTVDEMSESKYEGKRAENKMIDSQSKATEKMTR